MSHNNDNVNKGLLAILIIVFACLVACVVGIISIRSNSSNGVTEVQGEVFKTNNTI